MSARRPSVVECAFKGAVMTAALFAAVWAGVKVWAGVWNWVEATTGWDTLEMVSGLIGVGIFCYVWALATIAFTKWDRAPEESAKDSEDAKEA